MGLPSAATVSWRWSSVNTKTMFGRRADPRARRSDGAAARAAPSTCRLPGFVVVSPGSMLYFAPLEVRKLNGWLHSPMSPRLSRARTLQ